jgi:uncharacterized protein YqgC (DUF456 family)
MELVDRVKGILLTPQTEWGVIEGESGDPAFLFKNYVAILAAIPAVCGFIGRLAWLGLARSLSFAVVTYIMAFVVVYVVALLIDALAPTFNGAKNSANALKLAVYSSTPGWIVGVFALLPGLGVLRILGLYGLYLLWLGLPPLMKSPPDKAVAYTATIVVCAIVVTLVAGVIVGALSTAY